MSQTLAHAIRSVLDQALSTDPSEVLLGEVVGRMGGHAGTSAGLLEAHGPDRVRDLPIADRGTLGLALGLALAGKRPVIELAGSNRLGSCAEVLAEAAAIASRSSPTARATDSSSALMRSTISREESVSMRPVFGLRCSVRRSSSMASGAGWLDATLILRDPPRVPSVEGSAEPSLLLGP